MSTPTVKPEAYYPEIQGARVVGALLVAIFHIWVGGVSGGVDVFFVISGFLMTRTLMNNYLDGKFSFLWFWGGIIRRVAPVAYLVLFCTFIGSIYFTPQTRWLDLISEFKYSAVHLENWKLMLNSVDYLSREQVPTPLLHFWALSVQMQFYFIWPFVIALTGWLALKSAHPKRIFGVVIALFLAMSLSYSIWTTAADQGAAFFNTFARLWEFALGGLVAVVMPLQTYLPAKLRAVMGWLGLAGIISCGFVLDTSNTFPGYMALWPTLSASMLVLSANSKTGFGVERLLATKPFVALGSVSFSFYLWHWPILIFMREYTGMVHMDFQYGMAVILLTLALSFATLYFIETPMKRIKFTRKYWWQNYLLGALCAVPVMAGVLIWDKATEKEFHHQKTNLSKIEAGLYPGAALMPAPANQVTGSAPLQPGPLVVTHSVPDAYAKGCHQDLVGSEVKACTYGPQENYTKTIALVGGSHTAHWIPAFKLLAEKNNWRIISYTKSSCPLQDPAMVVAKPSCRAWNEQLIQTLLTLKPDLVFTTANRSALNTFEGAAKDVEFIPESYLAGWALLLQQGLEIAAIRDNPWMGYDVTGCIAKNAENPLPCARPRVQLLQDDAFAASLQSVPENVDILDLSAHFCDDQRCYAALGNLAIYRDTHHITVPFMETLAPALEQELLRKTGLGQ